MGGQARSRASRRTRRGSRRTDGAWSPTRRGRARRRSRRRRAPARARQPARPEREGVAASPLPSASEAEARGLVPHRPLREEPANRCLFGAAAGGRPPATSRSVRLRNGCAPCSTKRGAERFRGGADRRDIRRCCRRVAALRRARSSRQARAARRLASWREPIHSDTNDASAELEAARSGPSRCDVRRADKRQICRDDREEQHTRTSQPEPPGPHQWIVAVGNAIRNVRHNSYISTRSSTANTGIETALRLLRVLVRRSGGRSLFVACIVMAALLPRVRRAGRSG